MGHSERVRPTAFESPAVRDTVRLALRVLCISVGMAAFALAPRLGALAGTLIVACAVVAIVVVLIAIRRRGGTASSED